MQPTRKIFDSPLSVYITFLVVYLLSLTSNFTGPHDSMTYLEMLRTENHIWHPHHLIYHKLSWYWLHCWKIVFPGVQDYLLVESFGSVFGAGTIAFAYMILRKRFLLPIATSWLGAGIIAFSYGIWFYSANVEVYAPSLFFTAWTLYIATKKTWRAKDVWLAAILHSIAILFHQMNILITPLILYKIYEQRKNIYVWKSVFWYGLTGLVLVGGVYFVAGWFFEKHNDLASWISWLRGYTASGEYWRGLNTKTPVLAGIGFVHTILGGHFIFRMGLEKTLAGYLKSHELGDEQFLVRHLSQSMAIVLFILACVLAILTIILLAKFLARSKYILRNQYYIVIPLLIYFFVNSIYFLFWMPEILEFWLGQCIVFWLLLIGTSAINTKKLNQHVGLMLVLLITVNYFSSIRPLQDIRNDIGYVRIQKVRQSAQAGDLVIVQDPWLLQEFLEYYTTAKVVVVPERPAAADSLKVKVDDLLTQGHQVFIFPAKNTEHASSNASFVPDLLQGHKQSAKKIQEELTEVWLIR